MAESKDNIITHGLSGKVADLIVFSQRNGKTIVSKAPKQKRGEDSAKQVAHKLKFQRAVLYAQAVAQDAKKKALYAEKVDKEKGQSTYNIAVADLLSAPKIEKIDLSAYTGAIGDKISIQVTDDFMVKAVKVTIENGDGTLVESGLAVQEEIDWVYKATKKTENLTSAKLTIEASDLPDNLTVLEQDL